MSTHQVLSLPFPNPFSCVTSPARTPAGQGRPMSGLAIFYNTSFYSLISVEVYPDFLCAKLKCGLFYYIIVNVYISPSSPFEPFLNLLDELLTKFVTSDPDAIIIIGGDFNARVGTSNSFDFDLQSPYFERKRTTLDHCVNDRSNDLTLTLENHGFILLNGRSLSDSPANFTFVAKQGRSIVDLIWCSFSDLSKMHDLFVADWPTRSDHLPVVLELDAPLAEPLTNERDSPPPRLRWDNNRAFLFVEMMRWSPEIAYVSGDVDDLNDSLINTITNVALKLGLARKPALNSFSNSNKHWFDNECKFAKKEIKRTLITAKKSNFDLLSLTQYLDAKSHFKVLIKSKKSIHKDKKALSLSFSKNAKEFWSQINRIRNPIRKNPSLDIEVWSKFLSEIFPARTVTIPYTNFHFVPELDGEITVDEICESLNSCKPNKSPGIDDINYDFLKNLPDNWILYLCFFFNEIFKSETVPENWCQLLISPIHKKGDESDPKNYRLISLVNCIAKVYMQIPLKRIQKFCTSNSLIPEFQSGFRSGRSCLDNIFSLNSLIQINTVKPKSKVYAIFVDFRAAFDSIDHCKLWKKLQSFGLSSRILNTLRSFYSRASAAIKIKSEKTNNVDISKGVLQGEVLSPLLFSLFLSDLETYFREKSCKGIRLNVSSDVILLAYADDLVLFADSPFEVNRKLSVLNNYCNEFSLTVNTDKTKIVIFKKNRGHNPITAFRFGNEVVDVVDSYCYLGVIFSQNCKFDLSIANTLSNVRMANGSTLKVLNSLKTSAWSDINLIHNSLISSLGTYGCEVWGPLHPNELEKIQITFFKQLLRLPANCPSHALRIEIGRLPVKFILFKSIVNWIFKLCMMDDFRIPKLCFPELCDMRNRFTLYEFNWLNQIKPLFVFCDNLDVWTELPNPPETKSALLNRFSTKLRHADMSACRASHSLVLYNLASVPPENSPAPYLVHRDLSLPYKRIYARLRLLSLYNNRLVAFKTSIQTKLEFCKYCYVPLSENEFIHHCISECVKTLALANDIFEPNEVNSLCNFILNANDRDSVIKICKFIEAWDSLEL